MDEHELVILVDELAKKLRTEIGHPLPARSIPVMSFFDKPSGKWQIGVRILAVAPEGEDEVLWAARPSSRSALVELAEALRDMLRHGRKATGGDADFPVFYAPTAPAELAKVKHVSNALARHGAPPIPAVGQVWRCDRGFTGRTVRIAEIFQDRDGHMKARLESGHRRQRGSTVLLSTLLAPGSGWSFQEGNRE